MPKYNINFQSWSEMIQQVKEKPVVYDIPYSVSGTSEFTGTQSFEQALEFAEHGWSEGLRRINENLNLLASVVTDRKPILEPSYALAGPGTVDMGRYQQGHPMCWQVWNESEQDQVSVSNRIVPIVFNIGASNEISAQSLFIRGGAICRMIDILEGRGFRVEVKLAHANQGGYLWTCMLKKASEILDLNRMAFALANASMTRRISFRIKEQEAPELCRDSYGTPVSYSESGAINIYKLEYNIRDIRSVVEFMRVELDRFGISLEV